MSTPDVIIYIDDPSPKTLVEVYEATYPLEKGKGIRSFELLSVVGLDKTYRLTFTDDSTADIVISDGAQGVPGVGISSIALVNTDGIYKTYAITLTDNTVFNYIVTDGVDGDIGPAGNGIDQIYLYSVVGLQKTYRIVYTNGNHFDFIVTDGEKGDPGDPGPAGRGIATISLYTTNGLVKTYCITYTDDTTTFFDVIDGEAGPAGAGTWGSIGGTLANQTDLQNALDAKVTGNAAITPATALKISYDAKGLVTGSSAATGTDVGLGYVANQAQQIKHGFVTAPPSNPSFSTNTLTVPASYTVAINGVQSAVGANKQITISNPADGTQYFITMNGGLSLAQSTTAFDVLDLSYIPVVTAYYNDSGADKWIIGREWHQSDRNLITHKEDHESKGVRYITGFLGATFASGSTNTFSIPGGTISDEGLRSVISGAQTSGKIGFRLGTNSNKMRFESGSTGFARIFNSLPQYDNNGTLSTLSANKFGITFVFATNWLSEPIALILGQDQYDSVALAQAAPLPTLTGLSAAEWRLLYRVIYKANAAGNGWSFVQADTLALNDLGPATSGSATSTVSAVAKFKFALMPGMAELTGASTEPSLIGVVGTNTNWSELRYDDTTAQTAMWVIPSSLTKDYSGGSVTVRIHWKGVNTSNSVVWQVLMGGFADAEVIDTALQTARSFAADTAKGTTEQLNQVELTFTPTGAELTAGDILVIGIKRLTTDASDTFVGDAKLVSASIFEV